MIINSGTGNGKSLAIDKFNRATVFSTGTTQEHHASGLGQAYTQDVGSLAFASGDVGIFAFVRNAESSLIFSIQQLLASADVAGGKLEIIRNPTLPDDLTTLSNATKIVIGNNNFASSRSAKVDSYIWDGVGTTGIGGITGGDSHVSFYMPAAAFALPLDGAHEIGPNNVIALKFTAPASAVNLTSAIRIFFESVPAPVPS